MTDYGFDGELDEPFVYDEAEGAEFGMPAIDPDEDFGSVASQTPEERETSRELGDESGEFA